MYLIVVGLVLGMLRSLGARIDEELSPVTSGRGAMITYLLPLILVGVD